MENLGSGPVTAHHPKSSNLTAMTVASLLNPVRPQPRERGTPLPSSPSPSIPMSSPSIRSSPHPSSTPSPAKKQKMSKDGAVFSKGKVTGEVRYKPFEQLPENTMRKVQNFRVYPIGKIQDYSRHIPYNSEKKTFLEKTGRDSFEVFQYTFQIPGEEKEYTVMWDYNIGLVRITPFFKCCKYSKTTPARMLAQNPGLKEITHSITGGALAAQGYWMPFQCALAVCATFCHHIAPALIPIFGPDFPSECVLPEAPEHGRMVIDAYIIQIATAEAEAYRLQYSSLSPKSCSPSSSTSYSPKEIVLPICSTAPRLDRRSRLKRAMCGEGLHADTDTDTSSGDHYYSLGTFNSYTHPSHPLSWRSTKAHAHSTSPGIKICTSTLDDPSPNPILSAVPRSAVFPDHWRVTSKRGVHETDPDTDGAYDGEESTNVSVIADDKSPIEVCVQTRGQHRSEEEKTAALWLLNLHIKDSQSKEGQDVDGPRVKRRRPASL